MGSLFDVLKPAETPEQSQPEPEIRPLSKQEARAKLQHAVPKAIFALESAMTNGDYPEMVRAATAILDRAGYGPKQTVQIEEAPEDLSTLSESELRARVQRIYDLLHGKESKPLPLEPVTGSVH